MATLSELWVDDQGQDIAEYAVMLAAILVIVIGTIRLVGSNANNAFSAVSSSLGYEGFCWRATLRRLRIRALPCTECGVECPVVSR